MNGWDGGSPMSGSRWVWGTGTLLVLVAGALVSAGQRSAVDWKPLRAVVLESDDWGLAGFVPSAEAWNGLRREDLSPGPFPEIYWNSTLEDSAMVADLAAVLLARQGRDGVPAVLQPNYVMFSEAFENGRWRRYDLPDAPPRYARPGLRAAVAAARASGVWHPEFHAAWHYDPARRHEATAGSELATEAAARGIMLFPGSEAARELGPWRSTADLEQELDAALAVFRQAFGRRPGSMIAPDYTWDARIERLWEARALRVIQAKREQRNPGIPAGAAGRVVKVLDRQWSRATRAGRTYLERNCRLEPVQSPDADSVVESCVRETARAWASGEPAIVETHRVNYAHADPAVPAAGRRSLAAYLDRISAMGAGPVFMTDSEVAELHRRGTSVRSAGPATVLRNGTRSRRLAEWPAATKDASSNRTLVLLDAGFEGWRETVQAGSRPESEAVVQ